MASQQLPQAAAAGHAGADTDSSPTKLPSPPAEAQMPAVQQPAASSPEADTANLLAQAHDRLMAAAAEAGVHPLQANASVRPPVSLHAEPGGTRHHSGGDMASDCSASAGPSSMMDSQASGDLDDGLVQVITFPRGWIWPYFGS